MSLVYGESWLYVVFSFSRPAVGEAVVVEASSDYSMAVQVAVQAAKRLPASSRWSILKAQAAAVVAA
jgi:hypothetical protein